MPQPPIAAVPAGWLVVAAVPAGVLRSAVTPTREAAAEAVARVADHHDPAVSADALARVAAALNAGARIPDVPLAVQGTAFQHRVWRALCAVPPGRTRSYGALAREAGHPGAARAVAGACAANPAAPVIPCHRAVRAGGGLGGYRWGGAVKRALLVAEGAIPG